jgi:hypothetical protein
MSDDPLQAAHDYKDKFGDCPTISGLSQEQLEAAMELLAIAAQIGVPFDDDNQFYGMLGLDTPPEDAEI